MGRSQTAGSFLAVRSRWSVRRKAKLCVFDYSSFGHLPGVHHLDCDLDRSKQAALAMPGAGDIKGGAVVH